MPEGTAEVLPILRIPAETVVFPEYVFVPLRVRVPAPALVRARLFSLVPVPPRMPVKSLVPVWVSVSVAAVTLPLTTRLPLPLPAVSRPAMF